MDASRAHSDGEQEDSRRPAHDGVEDFGGSTTCTRSRTKSQQKGGNNAVGTDSKTAGSDGADGGLGWTLLKNVIENTMGRIELMIWMVIWALFLYGLFILAGSQLEPKLVGPRMRSMAALVDEVYFHLLAITDFIYAKATMVTSLLYST